MGNSKTKPETPSKENPTNESTASTSQLQIRNCVRNVRDNVPDLYPTSPYLSGIFLCKIFIYFCAI